MNERAWAIATALFGFFTLAVSVGFVLLPEMAAARQCLSPGAVIDFELAQSASELQSIFGAPGTACRPLAIAAMDAVNRLDMLAFIPAYTLFCVSAALFLSGGALLRPLAVAAVGAAVLAGAADYLETATLLAITPALDTAEPLLAYSQFGAWSKLVLLAAHALFCAGLCYLSAPPRNILGVLLVLPTFGVLAMVYDTQLGAVMNGAFALAWLPVWAIAIRRSVRAKGSQA